MADKRLEALRKALRARLRDGDDQRDVAVPAAHLRALLDEVGRLQQSNDRLRRQNRRVRLKLQRAGLADDVDGDGEGGPGGVDPGNDDDGEGTTP